MHFCIHREFYLREPDLYASEENKSFGRLINHSPDNPNSFTKQAKDERRIDLFTHRNIAAGEEILYNYDVKGEEDLDNFPFLRGLKYVGRKRRRNEDEKQVLNLRDEMQTRLYSLLSMIHLAAEVTALDVLNGMKTIEEFEMLAIKRLFGK